MADNTCFLDIETIPSLDPNIKEKILSELSPPGNIKKQSTIDAWWREKGPTIVEEKLLATALDPTYGQVICICWAFNDKPVQGLIRTLEIPEKDLLEAFYGVLEASNTDYLVFVGHNVLGFDLPFLWKRSIINSCRPPIALPNRRGADVYDTMTEWAGFNKFIKFDALCHALGLPGKEGMDGSMVFDYVKQGRYDEILAYCKQDVEGVRQIYRRMTFKNWVPSDEDSTTLADIENKKLEESGFFDKIQKEL